MPLLGVHEKADEGRAMDKAFERLSAYKVVPIIVMDHCDAAAPLAQALMSAGLPCAEITFRTAAAEETIRTIKKACPEILVGAGTVTNTEQVDQSIDAGAEFIVSPGLDLRVIDYCLKKGIATIPGCVTPSEVMAAANHGINVVKFFPAEQCGGIKTIAALSAPFPQIKFMPSGGIGISNIANYLAHPKVIACGGSWMVKKSLIEAGDFKKITELTKETVRAVSKIGE